MIKKKFVVCILDKKKKTHTSIVDNGKTNFGEIGVICCYFISFLVKVDREYNKINKASEPLAFWMKFHFEYNFCRGYTKNFIISTHHKSTLSVLLVYFLLV